MKHYKLVEFSSNFNVKSPPHKRKNPLIDDFRATVLGWNHFSLMWIVFSF